MVKLILDGQQRITSLYGIIRGQAPDFFDGSEIAFTDLFFNMNTEEFGFYSAPRMQGDPSWIDVSKLMTEGQGSVMGDLFTGDLPPDQLQIYVNRIQELHGIRDVDLHVEEVTGDDKTIDVVVDIFNRVNSGGTKLSKGDLALAKICASSPDARDQMKETIARWRDEGYHFTLDWLLRSVNTVTTGEARFERMHDISPDQFEDGQHRAVRAVDFALNLIAGRLGLDHDRVLFGKYAIPVMANYIDRRGGHITSELERDRLLYWYLQSAMWGRFSGSTETIIDRDLELITDLDGALDRLVDELRIWRGSLEVTPDNFASWSLGARFYPVLYLLTRTGEARDWGTGLPLREGLLGQMSQLEVHHIFPKAVLYAAGYDRTQVNAVANFCFLTKDTNLQISADDPSDYFERIEESHPGALMSQWIPMDRRLWQIDNYLEFLSERRKLLAASANELLVELSHETFTASALEELPVLGEIDEPTPDVPGGIEGADEQALIDDANDWVMIRGLPEGEIAYEVSNEHGEPIAVLDLAWPDGLQPGLSQPVALLIDENGETLSRASRRGFRCFTSVGELRDYVLEEVLAVPETVAD